MLESTGIKNSVITADAMYCQTKTADVVSNGGGYYALQVKENQKKLLNEIKSFFHKKDRDAPKCFEANSYHELDGEHGRINERCYRMLPITDWLSEGEKFKGSQAVIEVQRSRMIKDKVQQEMSYYITSLTDKVSDIANYIRNLGRLKVANTGYLM